MYSAVLMLALTAGTDSVEFGRNRCNGCSATACSHSACSTSSCSARHSLFGNRGHGCSSSSVCSHGRGGHGGCSSSYGCSSSHGCSSSCSRGGLFSGGGGLFHRNRCSSSCSNGYACSSSVVCTSGCTTGTGTPAKEMIKDPKTTEKPKKTSAPATIVINLPADARLLVDGNTTTSTTDRRTLVTPELLFGSDYVYNMTAEVVREGRTMTESQTVTVRGGETSTIAFTFPTQAASSC